MLFTATQQRILTAASQGVANVSAIAQDAGCTEAMIYRSLEDPDFSIAFQESLKLHLRARAPGILHKLAEVAETEGSHQQAKMILEIAGIYEPKKRLEAQVEVGGQGDLFSSPEERREFLRETLGVFDTEDDDE